MEKQYEPFNDYMGLSDCYSCHTRLEDVMNSSPGYNDNEVRFEPLYDGFQSFDPLDMIRSDAHEDFLNNGVEREIDEVDQLQLRIRTNDRTPSPTSDDAPLVDYTDTRNKRKISKKLGKIKSLCVFCKNNGEQTAVYTSHVLKDDAGRVRCPILRKYTCPLCGVSGDFAHTIRYCPKSSREKALATVLMSARLSNGRLKISQ